MKSMEYWINWPPSAIRTLMAILAIGTFLSACSTANPVLTFFFDGVPPPGVDQSPVPVVHQPRRAPHQPPKPDVIVLDIPDKPPPVDWRARFEALAKNADDGVDWVRAINDKAITPKPGIAADAKEEEPTEIDIEFVPKDQPEYKVVFSHKPHTQWLSCANCHTDIFEMEQGKVKMTMDKINAGAYCGVCHGKVALPELTTCPACHKAM